jgi:CubicO group peptidase (beta-lactamase class C family)
MLDYLDHYRLTRRPGAVYQYSNLGYGLLALALERAAGGSWERLVERDICRPLGMPDTRIHLARDQRARQARGYNARGEPAPYELPSWPAFKGAGALRSTLDDMLVYLRFNLGLLRSNLGALLPDLHREWRRGRKPSTGVGLGWQTSPLPGSRWRVVVKNGQTAGFHCWVGFVRESKTGVVLMANQVHKQVFDQAGREILLFLNRRFTW